MTASNYRHLGSFITIKYCDIDRAFSIYVDSGLFADGFSSLKQAREYVKNKIW